jgi:hypothetical protein
LRSPSARHEVSRETRHLDVLRVRVDFEVGRAEAGDFGAFGSAELAFEFITDVLRVVTVLASSVAQAREVASFSGTLVRCVLLGGARAQGEAAFEMQRHAVGLTVSILEARDDGKVDDVDVLPRADQLPDLLASLCSLLGHDLAATAATPHPSSTLTPTVLVLSRLCVVTRQSLSATRALLVPDQQAPLSDPVFALLARHLTSHQVELKMFVGELLFSLAENDKERFVTWVGLGNAAGFLHDKGIE